MEQKSIITPKSKVLQVIEDYPQLEEVLINYVPVFKNLKNPVLRKTVAKVATLQQAAAIANVKVEELVNHLRKEIGQDLLSQSADLNYTTEKPVWFNENLIRGKLNAKELLDRGEHPVNQVIAEINALPNNSIYLLDAPFLPAPLIDKATSLQYKHWVLKENENNFKIYFYKV